MNQDEKAPQILLVEDSPTLATLYREYLATESYDVLTVDCGADALEVIQQQLPDLILLDLRLPDMSGMDVLKHVHDNDLDTMVVIITAHGSVDAAVDAMQHGAVDFLTKPFDATRLRVTVANALDKHRLSHMVVQYQEVYERSQFHQFVGASMPMQSVYRIIENAAPSKATVFITGESGTGKELCADAVHHESPRRDHEFVALNCAAIPQELMESEIFGHVKGAFTGAATAREGAAMRANNGTLFLDEICEMDLALQSKLLRFIQTGSFLRIGDSKEIQVDIRIVCATNRDPMAEVAAGRFREDLYYRLNVIPLHLPPLRERFGDWLLIANTLIRRLAKEENKQFGGMSAEAVTALEKHLWPGNVRELENLLRNVIVLNTGEAITLDMLPERYQHGDDGVIDPAAPCAPATQEAPESAPVDSEDVAQIRPLWWEEKQVIERAIEACDGNVPKAAALLEISASTIYRKRLAWQNHSGE